MLIAALAWIVATLTVAASASLLARRLDPAPGSFAVVHNVVITWAWIVAVAAALSIGHWLTGPALIVGVSVVALATAIGGARRGNRAAECRPADHGGPTAHWPAALWASLLCLWGGHVVSGGLLRFTTDYDSLMYHLPLIDYWLQARSLYAPASGHWSNPGGNELLGLWAVAPFPNDCLVLLGNIPAVLLLSFGTLELGRLLGLVPVVKHAAAFAIAANFVVMKQLADAENDVAVAGLFVTCLCYGIRAARGGRVVDSLLGPASLGLLAGVKYYALGLAAVAWAFAVLLSWMRLGARRGLQTAITWATGATLVGGAWYARNMIASGSPFFPLVKGGGSTLLAMDYPSPWQTTFLGNGRPEVGPLALDALWRMTGPCQLAAISTLPGTLAWLTATGIVRYRRGAASAAERLGLALAMIGSFSVLMITPMALEDVPGSLNQLKSAYTPTRYGLGIISLATLGLVMMLHDALGLASLRTGEDSGSPRERPGQRRAVGLATVFGASALYQIAFVEKGAEVDWATSLLVAVALGMATMITVGLTRRVGTKLRALVTTGLIVIATGVAVAGILQLSYSWDAQFERFYHTRFQTQAIGRLRSLTPRPTRVAYFDYCCYPFFGPRRETLLCQQRQVVDFARFSDYLTRWEVSHLVVRSDHSVEGWDNYRSVKPWLDQHHGEFVEVYSDVTYAIYRRLRTPANHSM